MAKSHGSFAIAVMLCGRDRESWNGFSLICSVDWNRTFALQRILRATLNTMNGLRAAAASEAAFRQELIAFVIAVPLAFLIATGLWMRVALIGMIVAILVVELLNTAIEKLADRVTLDHDPAIGLVKDIGSAAVGLTLLAAGAVWLLALWERIATLWV